MLVFYGLINSTLCTFGIKIDRKGTDQWSVPFMLFFRCVVRQSHCKCSLYLWFTRGRYCAMV